MADFSQYGGASNEWLAVQAQLPSPSPGLSLQESKAAANNDREAVSAQAMLSMQADVSTQDFSVPTRDVELLEARLYRSRHTEYTTNSPVYMHLHGGGFLFGTRASEDAACARIVLGTGLQVLNVNYRHTPEHTFPTAWNDVEDTLIWLVHGQTTIECDARRIILSGISAGAWIAASLVLAQNMGRRMTDLPPFAGQILMIPSLIHTRCYGPLNALMLNPSNTSRQENENAPILPKTRIDLFTDLLQVDKPEPLDVFLNPGNASADQLCGMPPTVLGVAGLDPLRDEALLFGYRLQQIGTPTQMHLFKGVPHGFRRFGGRLSLCEKWDEVIRSGAEWILQQPRSSMPLEVHT